MNTIKQMADALRAKKASSVELTTDALANIKKHEHLNAFITVCDEHALARAAEADKKLAASDASVLTGIPMAHKDLFCTKDIRTTCASNILNNFISPYDATVVQKINDAGMVTVGKCNMDEFAMGSSNETSFFGAVKNPWDESRVPGGSSGGSAAAVAANLVPMTTGTDTGGSVRQPAAFTNLTGLRPTYGRVSRFGMVAFASSLDQGGVLAHTAEDVALVMEVMSGFDEKDSTSMNEPVPEFSKLLDEDLNGLRVGVPSCFFDDGLDPAIAKAVQEAVAWYESQGATIVDVDLPHLKLAVPAYYIVAPAEASSNLSRFDGVRFGHRCEDPKDLTDMYMRSRGEGFGDEVKRRIMTGAYVLSAGFYDAYYLKAQKVRQLIANDFKQAFERVDVMLGPTTPTTAFKIGEKINDPVTMYLNDIYVNCVNLAGLPAMSIPCGFANDLPIGLHLIGPAFSEAKLLNVAHKYQQATDWHTKQPSLS